jgi:hypothetical protein
MWKNIFFESCLLSALIFGGLYINANNIKEELYEKDQKSHICGVPTPVNHISGENSEDRNNISGASFLTDK